MLEWICGVVGVGEVVAGQGDDDLGMAVGEDALVAVGCRFGVAGVPEGLDEGGEGGMGAALEIEHASTSDRAHLNKSAQMARYLMRL